MRCLHVGMRKQGQFMKNIVNLKSVCRHAKIVSKRHVHIHFDACQIGGEFPDVGGQEVDICTFILVASCSGLLMSSGRICLGNICQSTPPLIARSKIKNDPGPGRDLRISMLPPASSRRCCPQHYHDASSRREDAGGSICQKLKPKASAQGRLLFRPSPHSLSYAHCVT